MEKKELISFKQSFKNWLSKAEAHHITFWLAAFLLLLLFDGLQHGFWFAFVTETVNLFFYLLVVYFNLYYLIPRYLNAKNYAFYTLLLLLSVAVVTPLRVVIFYFLFTYYPDTQSVIVLNRHWYFLVNLTVACVSTVYKIISDWARLEREQKELQNQSMQSELRFLRSQINPHFLFNTLNNLYALTLKKSDIAPDIVLKLAEMMRYMLYECNEKQVFLHKEISYLKNYLDLEKLRQSENMHISFETDGIVGEQKIAPLLFIPFLENSFKHGLNHHLSHGFVHIKLKIFPNSVTFFIENNKANKMPVTTHKISGGIGLVNVKQRLALLYPKLHELKIEDSPDTYKICLTLNLES